MIELIKIKKIIIILVVFLVVFFCVYFNRSVKINFSITLTDSRTGESYLMTADLLKHYRLFNINEVKGKIYFNNEIYNAQTPNFGNIPLKEMIDIKNYIFDYNFNISNNNDPIGYINGSVNFLSDENQIILFLHESEGRSSVNYKGSLNDLSDETLEKLKKVW